MHSDMMHFEVSELTARQVQFRLSSYLLSQLDKLCENGVYKTRSEAITDAIRHLLERYAFEDEISMLTSKYLSNQVEKARTLDEMTILTEEEWADAEKALIDNFGTTDVDQILRKLRGGGGTW